jgi:hypothetical protein
MNMKKIFTVIYRIPSTGVILDLIFSNFFKSMKKLYLCLLLCTYIVRVNGLFFRLASKLRECQSDKTIDPRILIIFSVYKNKNSSLLVMQNIV